LYEKQLSLSQNSVSFVPSSWKKRLTAVFPIKSKVAVPKTEVLGQPQLIPYSLSKRKTQKKKNMRKPSGDVTE
jgi:hypothetical protein